jgi:pimeloyl-ACP methyl ester carboxylesterase
VSAAPRVERRTVRGGKFELPLRWAGQGRPLVFLHDAWGFVDDWPAEGALAQLADSNLVLAPSHPGFDGATGLDQLDDLQDLALHYLSLLDELLVDSPYLIGHGFGGMIAAEMATLEPRRIAKLVLVGSYGLWLDQAPVADIFALSADDLDAALWHDPARAPARSRAPEDQLQRTENLAATAKFIWPIPDKGLRKRLYRLSAPTLLVWGEHDGVVPPAYAEAFRSQIASAEVALVREAGHFPHLEQPDAFTSLVLGFLEG